MAMLNEPMPKFAMRQVAQGSPYFDILNGQGLAKGYWNVEKGKGKIIIIFWEDKGHILKCLLKCGKRDRVSVTAVWTKRT